MLFEFNNALGGFSCTLIEFRIQFIKCYSLCAEFKVHMRNSPDHLLNAIVRTAY
jgi:hypothetical protein